MTVPADQWRTNAVALIDQMLETLRNLRLEVVDLHDSATAQPLDTALPAPDVYVTTRLVRNARLAIPRGTKCRAFPSVCTRDMYVIRPLNNFKDGLCVTEAVFRLAFRRSDDQQALFKPTQPTN